MQRGFAPIIILVGILVIAAIGGAFYLGKQTSKPTQPQNQVASSPSPTSTISPAPTGAGETADWRIYTSGQFGFSFRYPKNDYILINDNEKYFSQRSNINDIKQDFMDLMKHDPPVVLGAVSIEPLNKESVEGFVNPFSIWIFKNNEQINIDEWFNQYGYYPLHFGQAMKILTEGPNKSIQINNYQAKYGLQGGMFVVQNIYVPQGKRMILISVKGELNDQDIGSQIFSTFKFLK